jgi:hypothetical protein
MPRFSWPLLPYLVLVDYPNFLGTKRLVVVVDLVLDLWPSFF